MAQMAAIHLRLGKRSMGKVGEREAGKGGDRLLDIAHGAEKLKTSTALEMPPVIRNTNCLGLRAMLFMGSPFSILRSHSSLQAPVAQRPQAAKGEPQ